MTILQAQIVTLFIVVLWFKIFGLHRILLGYFNYPPFASKSDIKEIYLKPLGCYLCTSFWIGVIISIPLLITSNLENTIYFLMLNTALSGILDTLLGYKN